MFNTEADLILFIITSFVIFLILSSMVIIFTIKFQERKIAFSKTINNFHEDHLNQLLKAEIEIQEQTFENIARDIHDNVGQQLSCSMLRLNGLSLSNPELEHEVEDISELLATILSDLRDLSRSKSSDFIISEGLIRSVEKEIEQLKRLKQYNTEFILEGDTYFLESNREIMTFRIIQEALHNSIKHSKCVNIVVRLIYREKELHLMVDDDGKGIELKNICSMKLGFRTMDARSKILGGRFSVSNIYPHGTRISCIIPKHTNGQNN